MNFGNHRQMQRLKAGRPAKRLKAAAAAAKRLKAGRPAKRLKAVKLSLKQQ